MKVDLLILVCVSRPSYQKDNGIPSNRLSYLIDWIHFHLYFVEIEPVIERSPLI